MVTEKLLEEISKLSKSEWERVKTNVDYLYNIKAKEQEKELFLSEDVVKNQALNGPYPIDSAGLW